MDEQHDVLRPDPHKLVPNPTPEKLALAKTKSDAVAKVEGVYLEEYVEARRKKAKEDKRAGSARWIGFAEVLQWC